MTHVSKNGLLLTIQVKNKIVVLRGLHHENRNNQKIIATIWLVQRTNNSGLPNGSAVVHSGSISNIDATTLLEPE
jgi:hypothetical protein